MSRVRADALIRGAAGVGVVLQWDTTQLLLRFLDGLAAWNRHVRLTADASPEALARHTIDSLAVVPSLPRQGLVIDIGAGGGFPGIVLAAARPDLEFVLVDARRRAVSFLRETARSLPLPNVRALHRRAEELPADYARRAALVLSRAVRLDDVLRLAAPLLADDGSVLAMQTIGKAASARSAARVAGLELVDERRYEITGAGPRALLIFQRPRT